MNTDESPDIVKIAFVEATKEHAESDVICKTDSESIETELPSEKIIAPPPRTVSIDLICRDDPDGKVNVESFPITNCVGPSMTIFALEKITFFSSGILMITLLNLIEEPEPKTKLPLTMLSMIMSEHVKETPSLISNFPFEVKNSTLPCPLTIASAFEEKDSDESCSVY
jgi:hypothetical protein